MNSIVKTKAIYKHQALEKYQGNPFVEALPHALSQDDFFELIRVLKPLPSELESFSKMDVNDFIVDMKSIYIETKHAYQVYESVYLQLRQCYEKRSPLTANYRKQCNATSYRLKNNEVFDVSRPAEYVATVPSILVSGEAGTGKTVTIRRVLSLFPQVIEHEVYRGNLFKKQQVVWLSFDMQASKSRKALVFNFFHELERVVGHPLTANFVSKRDSVDQLFHAMQSAAQQYDIGIIHIDEAQFILNPSSKFKDAPSLPELEALFNKIGVPIIISTTKDALTTFQSTASEAETKATKLQTVRRLSSASHIKFPLWHLNSSHFKAFFTAYFDNDLFKNTHVHTDEFKIQLLVLCAGVSDAISALAIAFIRNYYLITQEKEVEDCLGLLKKVYKARLETWHAPLSKLRRNYNVLNKLNQQSSLKGEDDLSNYYDEAETHTLKPKRKRTSAHHLKAASTVERIDEGDEVIDADSIVASYEKRDES